MLSETGHWDLLQAASMVLVAGLLAFAFAQRRGLAAQSRRAEGLARAVREAGAELDALRAMLEVLPDGILVVNREGRALGWNARFAALTGVPADLQRVGATLDGVLRAQAEAGEFGLVDVDKEVAHQAELLRGQGARPLERVRPDGSIIELTATTLANGGLTIRCQDVTARREAEALRDGARRLAEGRSAAMAAAAPSPMPVPMPAAGPVPPALGATPALRAPDGLLRARRCRVLLVEDLPVNQIVTATQLRREGHHVDVAASGAEAVRVVAAAPYDLVLMDLMMPSMDGFEAARRIRRLNAPAGLVPIHALTANVGEDDRARCLAAGMQGMVSKPVPAGVLSRLTRQGPQEAGSLPPPAGAGTNGAAADGLLDRGRLADLRRDLPPATLASLCEQCLDDMAARLDALCGAAQAGDADALEAHAHALAGMAASYGLAAVDRQMRTLMGMARRGDLRGIRGMVGTIRDTMDQASAALRVWMVPE